jgi:hypothetical protein
MYHDLRDTSVIELLLDELPNLEILVDLSAIATLLEPVGLPAVERPKPEPVGMYLLSHSPSSLPQRSSSTTVT